MEGNLANYTKVADSVQELEGQKTIKAKWLFP